MKKVFSMKLNGTRWIIWLFLIVFSLFLSVGCGSKGGADEDGTGDDTPVTEEDVGTVTLSAESDSLLADGTSTTIITAEVRNTDNALISRSVKVNFSTTAGELSATSATTANGSASVILTSPTTKGTATVNATAEGTAAEAITVSFLSVPQSFSLKSSQNTVKSDDSDSAIITVKVLDNNHVAVEGITVSFAVEHGQISAATQTTDENGEAQITFSAGVDKTNQVVNVKVTVPGLESRSIPIQVAGTEISLDTDKTNLDIEADDTATLTITLRDSEPSSALISDAEVTATVVSGIPGDPTAEQGNLQLRSVSNPDNVDVDGVITGTTDANGEFSLEVSGDKIGQATVQVESLGDTKTQTYFVNSTSQTFAIIEPEEDPWGIAIGDSLTVVVRNPSKEPVQFSTTFGAWNGTSNKVVEVPVDSDGTASAILMSEEAGVASVQVFDTGDSSHAISDSLEVVVSAPSSTASKISLQASPSVVSPSTGDVKNSATITATVKNADDQVVGNAPVAFSIEQTTGGGESISPVIAYTNDSGIATTTFFSGSLASSAEGVQINAVVLVGSQTVKDSVNIVIGGTPVSLTIGQSTEIQESDDKTAYILPMSVLVSDSNGNPAPGAQITLGVWPSRYATGYWTDTSPCSAVFTGIFLNEDDNRNLIKDAGEDQNGDGLLTPPSSAAGTVGPPVSSDDDDDTQTGTTFIVESGADGVAAFNLVYLKTNAPWTEAEITASTKVAGSETQATYTFWLPILEGDECNLPYSPYNTGTVSGDIYLSTGTSQLLANGKQQATLSALAVTGGNMLAEDGTLVTFLVSQGGGSFSGSQMITASTTNGIAEAVYTAPGGISGGTTVKIIAGASGFNNSNEITITLGTGQLLLSSDKSVLLADGESDSQITAAMLDMAGKPVEGEQINFQVDDNGKGGFGETQTVTASATTGSGGTVGVSFNASTQGGKATITATVPDIGLSESIEIDLIAEEVGSITLTPDPKSIPADGATSAAITATVTGSSGNAMPIGTPVNFSTDKGTFANGQQNVSAEIITDDGELTVSLISDDEPGTAQVTCESGGVSQMVSVEFSGGGQTPVGSITLTPEEEEIPATIGSSTSITAAVKDIAGEDVPTGTQVDFETTQGTFANGEQTYSVSTAGDSGEVTVSLLADGSPGTAVVTASVTLGGATVSQRTEVEFTGSGTSQLPPAFIEVAPVLDTDGNTQTDDEGNVIYYPDPKEIDVKGSQGSSASKIVFNVFDKDMNPVGLAHRIDFEIVSGPDGGEALLTPFTTTQGGQVSTVLRTGERSGPVLIKPFYYNDSGVNTSSVQVTINSGPVVGEGFGILETGWAECTSSSTQTCPGETKNTIRLTLADIFGNPVPDGTSVSLKTYGTGGIIDPASVTTTSGIAEAILYFNATGNTAAVDGAVSVTAEAVNAGSTTRVTSLAVVPENAFNQIIYAATNGGGVYKSTDSGTTWKNISRSSTTAGQNWIDPYVNDIVADPGNSNIVYAATGHNDRGYIYRSLDGGQNWNSNTSGESNGIFEADAAVLTIVVDDEDSDNAPYVWIGTDGGGLGTLKPKADEFLETPSAVIVGNKLESEYWENSLFHYVQDIVKVRGTHRDSAVLYAATAIGVYRSSDGGGTWTRVGDSPFTGYHINTLELHPASAGGNSDVIYAGTQDAGVWVSTDSGTHWTQFMGGIGKGLTYSEPMPDRGNTGTGTLEISEIFSGAKSENWTVRCTQAAAGGGTFSVVGSVSGQQTAYDITTGDYTVSNKLTFRIVDGATDFVAGDQFTFSTVRDEGRNIRDLLVDAGNNKLYAVTYFEGSLVPHAIGNVYVHELEGSGSMASSDWKEANTDLPEYEPPSDTTLFAQHVLAAVPDTSGEPTNPRGLLIGGEGINLCKASAGLESGSPVWQKSKTGMNNTIMARIPVAVPIPDNVVLYTGDITLGTTTSSFHATGGRVEFLMTHQASVLFSVILRRTDVEPNEELQIYYKASTLLDEEIVAVLSAGDYELSVIAGGTWTVKVVGNVDD